jgi:hypothetical protein
MTQGQELLTKNYLITNYSIIWRDNYEAEPVEHRKSNAGRYAANVWLREELERMKIDKPDYLKEYEAIVKAGPPRCCHSCDYYRYDDGYCMKFKQTPPVEFVQQQDACGDWLHRIPF